MSISYITISSDTNVEDTRSSTSIHGPAPPAPILALPVTTPVSDNETKKPSEALVVPALVPAPPTYVPASPEYASTSDDDMKMLAALASPDYTPGSDRESEPSETEPMEEDPH
ncbi:hypothetical protein Tco_0211566 [Tanacetum coccineum]